MGKGYHFLGHLEIPLSEFPSIIFALSYSSLCIGRFLCGVFCGSEYLSCFGICKEIPWVPIRDM